MKNSAVFFLLAGFVALATPGQSSNAPLPESHAVWTGGEDGVNIYTIPGLLVTKSGSVLAYAEARDRRGDGGKVDMVIKRSTDGGRTWSKSSFIERAQGTENYVLATLVQDRVSGRIFFFTALRDEGIADRTTTNHFRYSDDDGVTWSGPQDITALLHAADERIQANLRAGRAGPEFKGDDPELFGRKLVFFGPGRSIQLSANHPRFPNRMVVPLFYIKDRVVTPRAKRGYGNSVLVSDDGGRTWNVPGTVPLGEYGSSEISIVELADGRIAMNARGAPPESSGMSVAGRTLAFSADGGATWTRPVPDTSGIPNYIETSSGLLRISRPSTDPAGRSRILFSFPHSLPPADTSGLRSLSQARANGTILLSYDEGKSWPVRKLLVPGSFGYSNLDLLPDGTVLAVHENATGTVVSATRFTLEWLTDDADSLGARNLPVTGIDPETAVRQLDATRLEGLVRGDLAALRGIFHPEGAYTHGSGLLESNQTYLSRLERGELRYLAMRYELPPVIRIHDGHTAVVNGRVQLTSQGRSGAKNDRTMAVTAVYARGETGWRLVSYQSTPAPAAPRFEILGTYLATKDTCAWPKLVLGRDGTIYAALYNQPAHGQLPGDVACWASADGGQTWEFRGNATQHVGNQAWFNHALGLAANGDLLVATSGWDYRTEKGGKQEVPLVPIVTRSSDGGRTWRQVGRFPATPEQGKAFVPFGNIDRGDDGVLRVAAFSYVRGQDRDSRTDQCYVIESADDGKTWTVGAQIDSTTANETDLFHVGGTRWLAAARNLGDPGISRGHSMDLFVSEDNAKTWRRQGRLTGRGQHPGDLHRLRDGRILLVYGDRQGENSGVNARVSADGGATWSPEVRIAGPLPTTDSGYPSSVQLADGTIVTAYYAKSSPLYAGYQMAVVRWRLE